MGSTDRQPNQQSTQDMEKIPLRPLHCSAQTPSAPAQRSREGPQIPASWWTWRRKGDLELLQQYNLIKDGRFQPLTFDSFHYFFVQTKGPGIVLCDCTLSLLKAVDLIPGSVTTTTARHPSDFAIPPTCGLLGEEFWKSGQNTSTTHHSRQVTLSSCVISQGFSLPLALFHKILYPSCCLRLYLYTRPKLTQNIWDRAEEKVLECH